MTNRQLFQRYLAQTSPQPLLLEFVRAEGSYLFTPDGSAYLDFISGIAVSSLGHSRPEIVEAIAKQAAAYMHLMVYGEFVQSPQIRLAQSLQSILPPSLDSFYFVNSGAEASEGAIKLVKRYTGRKKLIAFRNAYHGSTNGALSLMSDSYFTAAFQPLLPDVQFIDYGDINGLTAVDENTAAVFMEVIQAESGVHPASDDFLHAVRKACDEVGALLVFDECQTGLGRTAKMFAFEHSGVLPDVLLLAKALGGGMPMGCFISSREIMHCLSQDPVLGHITTFGGHPVCCAAAEAALQILKTEIRLEEVERKGAKLEAALQDARIVDIRRRGLMMAIEFKSEAHCKRSIDFCIQHALITDWFLFAPHCMRIAPPLSISDEELDRAIDIIKQSYAA